MMVSGRRYTGPEGYESGKPVTYKAPRTGFGPVSQAKESHFDGPKRNLNRFVINR